MSNPDIWSILWLTLRVALLATAFSSLLGVGAGFFCSRIRFRGRTLVEAILSLPLVLPPTVLGYYLLVLFGRNGWIGRWLHDILGISLVFTWQGAVLAAAVVSFPLVFRASRSAFDGVPRNLEHAARTLGSREPGVFFRITLPLAFRGILAGVLLAFARAMGEFGATMMFAGNIAGKTQTLSMAVYTAVQSGDDLLANQLAGLLSILSVGVMVVLSKLVEHSNPLLVKGPCT